MYAISLFALFLACGSGADQHLQTTQDALSTGAWADAITAADAGLAADLDEASNWRLYLMGLEAHARSGDAGKATEIIEQMAGKHPDRVTGKLYVSTAAQIKETGDSTGAINLLDAGAKRFPDDAEIAKAIEDAKASGSDAELEQLRSLGYME
ncbi:MAG: hypothetical protein QGG40_20110 [Myxococcota bacterium]|jgi:hypothetical protein|nr:hypothetical protein [Myxococcota bacterium]